MSFIHFRQIAPLCLNLLKIPIVPCRGAARKGTRERKQKKKVKKVVEEKPKFVPYNQRKREAMMTTSQKLKYADSWKSFPVDDVYKTKYYRMPVYSFAEAVQNHRETHHPEMYNVPNAPLRLHIELNMQAEKVTRFIDDFQRTVAIPTKFDHGEERTVIAFCKSEETRKEAIEQGAQLVGGVDLIKQIQNGSVALKDFQYILAHPDILPELVALRGLMKRRFPNTGMGTLGIDMAQMTKKFLNGIVYKAKKNEFEKDFGVIDTVLGTLDMDINGLQGNFSALINDVYLMKPKRDGEFILRCLLTSEPSSEKLKVDHEVHLVNTEISKQEDEEAEDDKGVTVAL